MEQTEPLIHWPQPFIEYLGFVAAFLGAGAIGFRFSALRGRLGSASADERLLYAQAARRAALLGLLGVAIGAVLFATRLPGMAVRQHTTVAHLLTGSPPVVTQVSLLLVAIVGFALAAGGAGVGWPLAAVGVIGGTFRSAFFGQWDRLINPIHELAAGMWIGTLFVLVVVGLAGALRSGLAPARRGTAIAGMVNAFSPLALGSAAVLVTFGVITAWRHLKGLASLWTTPYGYALIAKLCVVLVVFALGAWNNRRQLPKLGTERAAVALRRSASTELAVAAVVLAITAVLVSLPSPND
jgi:putative copper export protein